MRYKLLGKSGLRVSELCYGAMTFGEEWGWGSPKDESRRVLDAFGEAGGNFIDTANKYTDGTSEKWVGEFIAADREHWVLATKYSLSMDPRDPNASGNQRKNMVQAVDASLKRLGTDYIDLYWVHVWDFMTPVEEIMRGLDDLVRAGKIIYVGASDWPAWRVSQANTLAELRGWTPFVALQVKYSLLERTTERDLLPMARALDLAVTPWGVLGGGVLSGKYSKTGETIEAEGSKRIQTMTAGVPDEHLAIAEEVKSIASAHGATPSQVALSWVRQQEGVILPIVGARTEQQITDNLACLDVELSEEELRRLDQVSHVDLGFPHEFLSKDNIREVIYGETFPMIDNHRGLK